MKHPGGGAAGGAGHSAKHTRSGKHAHNKAKHNPKGQKAAHHHATGTKVHTVAKHPSHPRGLAIGDLLPVCTFEALAMSLRLAGQRVDEDDLLGLWHLAGAREVGIAEALDAASRFGLAGCRPVPGQGGSLILGVDLPGPHAVLATPDGWWSWGRLWSPWTAAVSEAREVSWL